jgi:hypothetical protein
MAAIVAAVPHIDSTTPWPSTASAAASAHWTIASLTTPSTPQGCPTPPHCSVGDSPRCPAFCAVQMACISYEQGVDAGGPFRREGVDQSAFLQVRENPASCNRLRLRQGLGCVARGPYIIREILPLQVFGPSGQRSCAPQRPGFNVQCVDGPSARWGFCNNAPSQVSLSLLLGN